MSAGVIFLVFLLALPVILITSATLGEREDRSERIARMERELGFADLDGESDE